MISKSLGFQKFRKFQIFWKISKIWENFKHFEEFQKIWKMSTNDKCLITMGMRCFGAQA